MPEALKADYQLVKNIARTATEKHQQLDKDVLQSMRKWAENLKAMGWHVMSRITHKPEPKVVVAFFFPWQKEQIRINGNNLICIHSTHNATKLIPQFGMKKLSTFTLLIQQPNTGGGLPVAWFLKLDETA